MSDYFSKRNNGLEFGPGPTEEIEWLIVQHPGTVTGISQAVVVRTKTAYLAWDKAATMITDFRKQDCYCYPNPKLIYGENK